MKMLLAVILLFCASAQAVEPAPLYTVDKAKSTITFTAVQNNAPVTGSFQTFDAQIRFSPDALETSSAIVSIDTGSVQASYGEVASNLKGKDWFAVDTFPKAIFTSKKITHLTGNRYQADATLTIRDKTVPVKLDFTLTQFSPTHATVDGTTTLKRTDFGIGQGEWKDTSAVKEEVRVAIHLIATTGK